MHIYSDADLIKGLTGGVVLATSTSLFLYLTGRVTGISGIVGNVITSESTESEDWSTAYVLGLISSGAVCMVVYPEALVQHSETMSPVALAVGGALVGFGTRLSNGCTSGHGLCGLGRLSLRSFVAVGTFMMTGAIGAHLRDLLPKSLLYGQQDGFLHVNMTTSLMSLAVLTAVYRRNLPFLSLLSGQKTTKQISHSVMSSAVAFTSGVVFGTGLCMSGMVDSGRVVGFLHFTRNLGWDYTLAGVMGAGVVINLVTFSLLSKRATPPPFASELLPGSSTATATGSSIKSSSPSPTTGITWQLVVGACLFGIGWGLTGVCPGPSVVLFGSNLTAMHVYVPAMAAGMVLHKLLM